MWNSGWANNCGVEIFTQGWVKCPSTVQEQTPIVESVGGSGSGPKSAQTILQLNQPLQQKELKAIIENEDEAAIAMIMMMVETGLIQ